MAAPLFQMWPVILPYRKVVTIDTQDGPIHLAKCTVCGLLDPDAATWLHNSETCYGARPHQLDFFLSRLR